LYSAIKSIDTEALNVMPYCNTDPAARSSQHSSQILVEVIGRVLVVNFHLEDTEAVHPRNETRQRRLARATDSDEQQMTLRLAEDTVNTQHVVQNFIKQHQWNVELLLVEHLHNITAMVG